MPTITTKDGTPIYYKDWGTGRPVVFSHGWPLTADAWDDQMVFLAGRGFRCVAHDRRGHGRSGQPWGCNDMDTYADDLAELVAALDLKDAVHVGHSTGGGEVARYIGRHGTKRVAKAVLISAIPPLMLKTPANPGGLPIEAFDQIRAGVLADRSQFFKDLSGPFYGANRLGSKVSQGLRDSFWLQGMQGGHKGLFDCIRAFSETDHTEDLKRFDVPTLILHGDDDQIVPIGAAALLSVELVKGAELKVYNGGDHGICSTHKDQVNADLLAFLTACPPLLPGATMGFGFSPFTQVHVLISLVGIAAGFVVAFGLLTGRRLPITTAVFLAFTIATSVTGFFFPITQFTPALAVGGLSLVVLGVAVFTRYFRSGSRVWQRVYAGTALFAQYMNVFVLVAQLFQKVPALKDLAPTQTEPPFGIAQGVVFLAFVVVGVLTVRRAMANAPASSPVAQPAGIATG